MKTDLNDLIDLVDAIIFTIIAVFGACLLITVAIVVYRILT